MSGQARAVTSTLVGLAAGVAVRMAGASMAVAACVEMAAMPGSWALLARRRPR